MLNYPVGRPFAVAVKYYNGKYVRLQHFATLKQAKQNIEEYLEQDVGILDDEQAEKLVVLAMGRQ